MSQEPSLGHLKARFVPIPSNQMVIRKYKPLKEQYIRDFFEEGIRCTHVPEFNDDNEGMIESPAENPALRGAAAAIAGRQRRRKGKDGEVDFSEEDFRGRWSEFHERARNKYFASCWRLGTREFVNMWQNYSKAEELKQGFAIETTVGQFINSLPVESGDSEEEGSVDEGLQMTDPTEMYVGAEDHDIHIGAVQYQKRDTPDAVQPTGYQESVNFFKGSSFDYEVEFRLLINPFDSANLLRLGEDGVPIEPFPDVDETHPYFPMDTVEMVNRIVLAPAAGKEERARVEGVLDDLGISYGSEPDDDLQIVSSNLCTDPRSPKQPYAAEFRGTANYDGTESHLEEFMQDFLDRTEVEEWAIVDFTELESLDGGVIVEGYRHAADRPDIQVSDYGHNGLQSVFVNRRFWNEDRRDELIEEGEAEDS
jgi:hypothetical protein